MDEGPGQACLVGGRDARLRDDDAGSLREDDAHGRHLRVTAQPARDGVRGLLERPCLRDLAADRDERLGLAGAPVGLVRTLAQERRHLAEDHGDEQEQQEVEPLRGSATTNVKRGVVNTKS